MSRPTIFPMAGGMGLMGEAGAEAVMPLRRGPDGRLGVTAQGSSTSIVVSPVINITGGDTSDPKAQAMMGKRIAEYVDSAVRKALVAERRSGGLLQQRGVV